MVTSNIADIGEAWLDIHEDRDALSYLAWPLTVGVAGLTGLLASGLLFRVVTGDVFIDNRTDLLFAAGIGLTVTLGAGALALRTSGATRTFLALVAFATAPMAIWPLVRTEVEESVPGVEGNLPQTSMDVRGEMRSSTPSLRGGARALSPRSGRSVTAYQ